MNQWVTEVETGGLRWEPNAPEAVMVANDRGLTALALRAHPDDGDRRCVVFLWRRTESASLGGPNDEGLSAHRLYDRGLSDVQWLGEVRFGSGSLVHHLVPLKECMVEVIAHDLDISRHGGSTLDAAAASIRD